VIPGDPEATAPPNEAQLAADVQNNAKLNVACTKTGPNTQMCVTGTTQNFVVTTFTGGVITSEYACQSTTGWTVTLGVTALATLFKGTPISIGINGAVSAPAGFSCTPLKMGG
jgi:hypothetical protein